MFARVKKSGKYQYLQIVENRFEWAIKQDLAALQTVTIEEGSKRFAIRTECRGNCGKIFQAAGVALPPLIREII